MADEGEEVVVKAEGVKHGLSLEEMKFQGNLAFKRASLLKKTTAGKQYLDEAKAYYIEAIRQSSAAKASPENLSLVCMLHSNLAAVYLAEVPPKWPEAKAATDIALMVEPNHVKARFRRAQALLEDNREGLPEEALREALVDLKAANEEEPSNAQVSNEVERIYRRLEAFEAKRAVPSPSEIVERISATFLDRGDKCLAEHGYAWGQTDTTVHIFIPARGVRITRGSQVTCEVKVRQLKIELPADQNAPAFKIDKPLHKPVKPDESSWQLEEGGLVLHIELCKRDVSEDKEHWKRVWDGHKETMAPTAKERQDLQDMAHHAGRLNAEEASTQAALPSDALQAEKLKRWKEIVPGVDVQWGDTSLDSIRQHMEDL